MAEFFVLTIIIFILFWFVSESQKSIDKKNISQVANEDREKKLTYKYQEEEEEERNLNAKPFSRVEAEDRAAKYHQQKEQFLEIVDEKTKKEKLREKVKAIRKMEKDLRGLQKHRIKRGKDAEKLRLDPKYSTDSKGRSIYNHEYKSFRDEVLKPLDNKIFILEAEIKNAKYGTPPGQDPNVIRGKRGGRYTLETTKDGRTYRRYF